MTKTTTQGVRATKFDAYEWGSAAHQVLQMADFFFETPQLQLFLKRVEYAAISAAYGLPAEGLWLFGGAGAGKTTALKEATRRLRESVLLSSRCPSILIALLPNPTMHSMVRDLLRVLQYPYSASKTFDERVDILFEAIRSRGIRVLMIDEVQHTCLRNRPANLCEIRDFLKRLIDETNVCLVLAGIVSARQLVEGDEQLASRLPAEIKLKVDFNTEDGKALAQGIISGAPLVFSAGAKETLVSFMAKSPNPSIRLLAKIAREAVKIALLTKASFVDTPHVQHAICFTLLEQPS